MEGVGTELEVPDHPDATIRLHKARIKSLSSEVGAAQTALKDKCVHLVAPHSLCLLYSHACHAVLTLNVIALKPMCAECSCMVQMANTIAADASAGAYFSMLCVLQTGAWRAQSMRSE